MSGLVIPLRFAWLLALVVLPDMLNSILASTSGAYINGALHLSPDEGSWYGLSYLMVKIACFPLAVWASKKFGARHCILVALLAICLAVLLPLSSDNYALHLFSRVAQGGFGALLLVATQLLLLQIYQSNKQGIVQAIFALALTVFPSMLLPLVLGIFNLQFDWSYAYILELVIALPVFFLLLYCFDLTQDQSTRSSPRLDWLGNLLFGSALATFCYLMNRGSRYNWFDKSHIVVLTGLTLILLLSAGVSQAIRPASKRLFNLTIFTNSNFSFAFPISFLAGYMLASSSFIITALASRILHLNSEDLGWLTLPSAAVLTMILLINGSLITYKGLSPVKLVPFGLVLMVTSLWWLSGSSTDIGAAELQPALVVRSLAVGCLFIAVTLIALTSLNSDLQADGIGLFNIGRQIGGLVGVGYLQSFIVNKQTQSQIMLAADVNAPNLADVSQNLTNTLDNPIAGTLWLNSEFIRQVSALAINDAFLSIICLVFIAIPLVIVFKVMQKKFGLV